MLCSDTTQKAPDKESAKLSYNVAIMTRKYGNRANEWTEQNRQMLNETRPNPDISPKRKDRFKHALEGYAENKNRYQKVPQATGVPVELIASIHYLEGRMKFDRYLHNGQRLGKVTTIVPKGLKFDEWEEAAIHALGGDKEQKAGDANGIAPNPKFTFLRDFLNLSDPAAQLAFAEMYNGPGYRGISKKTGRLHRTPYVWAGSNHETRGRFVKDHKFDPKGESSVVGAALLIQGMKEVNLEMTPEEVTAKYFLD